MANQRVLHPTKCLAFTTTSWPYQSQISASLNWDEIINSLPTVHAHHMQHVKYLQEQGAAVLPKEHNEENWDLPTPAHPSAHCLSATTCAKYLVWGLKPLWTQNPWPHSSLRYAGVICLLFIIRHLYLIGVWFGEDQRTKTTKHMFKRDWLSLQILLSTPHSIVNTIGRTYVFN